MTIGQVSKHGEERFFIWGGGRGAGGVRGREGEEE